MSNQNNNMFREVRCEYNRTNRKLVIFMPILLMFLGIFTRWVSGSPIPTLHYIGARELVPPVWLMVLLFSASYLVAGLSLGMALGRADFSCEVKKYQGAMWFCISLALGYIWYPLFFCARVFLVSAVVSAVCFFASICATVCFAYVSKIALFLGVVYDAWLIYLVLLNMQIFFKI